VYLSFARILLVKQPLLKNFGRAKLGREKI